MSWKGERSLRSPRILLYCGVWAPQVWVFCAAHRGGVDDGGVPVTPLLYLAMSLFMVVMVLLYGRKRTPPDGAWISAPMAFVTIVASVLLCLQLPFSETSTATLGAILGGMAMAWMYARWARFYSRLDMRYAVLCFLLALIIGSLVKIGIDFLPLVGSCVAMAALGVLSPVMLYWSMRHPPETDSAAPREPAYTRTNVSHLWKISAGVVVFGLIIGAINGMNVDLAAPLTAGANALLHICEIALGVVAIWWCLMRHHDIDFFQYWRVILVFMATGLVVLPFLSGDASAIALAFMGVAQTVVVVFLWLAIVDVAHNSDIHPYAVFGAGWMLYALPLAVGFYATSLIPQGTVSQNMAMIMSYAIILLLVFVLDAQPHGVRKLFASLDPALPEPADLASVDARCQSVGANRGLTAREVEVLQMICRGRSKGYIAEALFISENTVRGHSKHIYVKLGVHNKQELIDLITRG